MKTNRFLCSQIFKGMAFFKTKILPAKAFLRRVFALSFVGIILANQGLAKEIDEKGEFEVLELDIISYDDFIQNDPQALRVLSEALHEKGIVGISQIPGYAQKVRSFIKAAREFAALPEDAKSQYAPNHDLGEMFLGYEAGKERFKRPDGKWVVDDLKVSYYAYVPESRENKWPVEVDLKAPFQDIGSLMRDMGEAVMRKINLVGPKYGISLEGIPGVGRMLYYRKVQETRADNPLWCGAHFDHGLFTALLPAFYFLDGEAVKEPLEAGLFVRTTSDGAFKKVAVNDPDVLLFQVGEFGQLATNDEIRATEHKVQKATGCIERYTMALFFEAPMDTVLYSSSELTTDERYGGVPNSPCSYRRWQEESFKRYLVKEEDES